MPKKRAAYYVVWQGREPGIYDNWPACEQQVKGVTARYKGFATLAEAEAAYAQPAPALQKRAAAARQAAPLPAGQGPTLPALAVDAACSGNPGVMEFRGVIADTGTEVFHRGPYKGGTNNIGEFLAIVLGLAYLQKYDLPWVLYSDSKTAQSWVRQRQCKTKLEWNSTNAPIMEMVRKAEEWLHSHTWKTQILKWDTAHWGEIPADFGRK